MFKEDFNLEFKSEYSRSFLKTVSAFANYGGGEILFGIDDNGETVGLTNPDDVCLRIENAINDSIEPLPNYSLKIEKQADLQIVRLKVSHGVDTPYCFSGRAYKRHHTSTIKVDSSELRHLAMKGMNISFEECVASDQALEFSLLESKLMEKLDLNEIDEKVYRTLELTTSRYGFNNAAAVLADENRFPGIDIVRFGSTINEFMDRQTVEHVSALKLYDDAMEMFDRYYTYESVQGTVRETDFLIPEVAYRESIANALVHRVWNINGMIRVSCFDDRIEVSSPGGLPNNVSEEDYLAGRLSVLRNPIIAGVFARLGYIERFGTGIPRIRAAYENSVLKPRFIITMNSITVSLPVITGTNELSSSERAVLELLKEHGSLTRSQIEENLKTNKSNVVRILKKLGDKKLINIEGVGRATRYKL